MDTLAAAFMMVLLAHPELVIAVRHCVEPDGSATRTLILIDPSDQDVPPPQPDAATLATQVRAALPLQLDPPQTAPPSRTLTGLPTWVWEPPDDVAPATASRTAGGLTVTVTATPAGLTVDPGDGTREHCEGPGTPWHPGAHADDPGACTHTYAATSGDQPGGVYRLTVTATWHISWRASNGESGTLADVKLANHTQLRVQQLQPVLDP